MHGGYNRETTILGGLPVLNEDLVNLPNWLVLQLRIEGGDAIRMAVRDQLGTRWEATPVVLRMFDPQLARSVRHNFGFRNVRSTAALAAPWFVGAALGLDVLNTFYVGDEPLLVARLTVSRGGGLDGLAMGDLGARTRILAISRVPHQAYLEHPPRRGTRLRAADQAYLIGPYEELLAVLRRDRPPPQAGHVPRRPAAPSAGPPAAPAGSSE